VTATVGDLNRMLAYYKSGDEVTFFVTTTHRTNSAGISVRVALHAGGNELLNMEFDNLEEKKR